MSPRAISHILWQLNDRSHQGKETEQLTVLFSMAPCDPCIVTTKTTNHLLPLIGFPLFLTQKVWQDTQERTSQRGCKVWALFRYYLWRCWDFLVNLMKFIVCWMKAFGFIILLHDEWWSLPTKFMAVMKFQHHCLPPSVWFQNSLTPTEHPSLFPSKVAHWFLSNVPGMAATTICLGA